jgi:hypothetical protein
MASGVNNASAEAAQTATNISVAASIDFMTIFPSIDESATNHICLFGNNGLTVRQTRPEQKDIFAKC